MQTHTRVLLCLHKDDRNVSWTRARTGTHVPALSRNSIMYSSHVTHMLLLCHMLPGEKTCVACSTTCRHNPLYIGNYNSHHLIASKRWSIDEQDNNIFHKYNIRLIKHLESPHFKQLRLQSVAFTSNRKYKKTWIVSFVFLNAMLCTLKHNVDF